MVCGMSRFVVQLTFTEHGRRLEARPAHRAYLQDLLAQGKLVTSGPWADDSGALLIYEVADEQEMRAIIAADPYTEAGVVEVTLLREWTPIFP
jgi:hypothetical protein